MVSSGSFKVINKIPMLHLFNVAILILIISIWLLLAGKLGAIKLQLSLALLHYEIFLLNYDVFLFNYEIVTVCFLF